MSNVNMEYYKTFYYVSKYESFTEAAQALYISQPAVSQSISKLEKELGQTLFIRMKKKVVLTAAGEMLFDHVEKAFREISIAESRMKQTREHSNEVVTITAPHTQFVKIVVPTIKDFQDKTNARFSITEGGNTAQSINTLMEKKADIAMGVWDTISDVESVVKYRGEKIELVLVANEEIAKEITKPLTREKIVEYPIVSFDMGAVRGAMDKYFLAKGLLFQPQLTVRSYHGVINLVKQGLGIGMIPIFMGQEEISEGKLRIIETYEPLPSYIIGVAHRYDTYQNSLVMRYIKYLIDEGYIKPDRPDFYNRAMYVEI